MDPKDFGEIEINQQVEVATGLHYNELLTVKGHVGEGTTGASGAIDRITHEILLSLEERKTLVLWLFDRAAEWWWLWAWGSLMVFQLLMVTLAPKIIMPLFNKFTPLPDGSLKDRLLALGERTGFSARTIQVMDGSRRSRHSNAFFTGFGRWRKIVLFDTLIEQLQEEELEAVLAHEIGHYKKGHIPKTLALSAAGSLVGFWVVSLLVKQAWFVEAFGFTFQADQPASALLLMILLGGTVSFWLLPLANRLSRKYEYEADAYAAGVMGGPDSMIGALRKLAEKNLSNLIPDPIFSRFYYSHPTLFEREKALTAQSKLGSK